MNNNQKKSFLTKIDIITLLIIITVFLTFSIALKFVFQKDTYITVEMLSSGGEWWWGTPPPYYWNINPLVKGAVEYDILRKPMAEILDVVKLEHDNRKLTWLKVKLKVRKNTRTDTYNFRQSKVEIGRNLTISPNHTTIMGNVVGIEGVSQLGSKETITFTGKIYSMYPWMTDTIEVGDTVKNDKGEAIAEILTKTVEPTEITTTTWQGEPLLKRDPIMKTVTLKIRMDVLREEDQMYFMYYQLIQEGIAVSMQMGNTTITPFITKIDEKES